MLNIEDIIAQVRHNCEISDAKSWGTYSICGLLLRLRDQYRWERGFKPWIEINHSEILDWVSEKEKSWELFAEEPFQNIKIYDDYYLPFNLDSINIAIKSKGLLYGAGFIGGLRPSFFLGYLKEKWREEDFNIFLLDKEVARDIGAAPSLSQGKDIILRKEPLRYSLWDKFREVKSRKSTTHTEETALSLGFKAYGMDSRRINMIPEEIEADMERIISEELECYFHHELGETYVGSLLGEEWKELLCLLPQTRFEHLIRGIKDIMADTIERGMLWHIIKHRKIGSLGFYVSQLGGTRREIFTDIYDAYKGFIKTGDISLIDNARKAGYEKVKDYSLRLLEIYKKKEEMGIGWVRQRIEEMFVLS